MLIFQSTLSVWRVTLCSMCHKDADNDFNPHSPYGEWPNIANLIVDNLPFQSTLSVWRVTYRQRRKKFKGFWFQSTLSVWRVTQHCIGLMFGTINFNPHSPYGEWLNKGNGVYNVQLFQSTLSVWRVTRSLTTGLMTSKIFQSTLSVWRVT